MLLKLRFLYPAGWASRRTHSVAYVGPGARSSTLDGPPCVQMSPQHSAPLLLFADTLRKPAHALSSACPTYNHAGADSEDASDDASDAEVARAVMANALLVAQCGKPMQAGAWRGCCKSPL